ncbi:MAG: TerB family tellurite resistance protein [Nitrospiria bacterium]
MSFDNVSKEKQLSLIRVLIALAWADGEISNEELNFLKDFIFKFDFTGEDWAKIEMYMEDPIPPEEAVALIQDFVLHLGGQRERKEVISALEGIMAADGTTRPEEKAFLERCIDIFQATGPSSALIGRLRGLFRETVFKPTNTSQRKEELHDFLNNRILFKVRRKLEREKLALEADPDKLAYASLFAGLLAHIASIHGSISEKELAVLRQHLEETAGFDREAIELILSVIQESAAKGLDCFRLTREFYERSSPEQRRQLVDCLFDIAGADDHLAYSEVEEVRTIAYGLKFSHQEFIDAKVRHLDAARQK